MAKNIVLGLTFDDVLLIPNRSDIFSRKNTDISSKLTKNIILNLPIISANMDTVTEGEMAIAMATEGGLGIIHRFLPIEKQVDEVKKVKRQESFIVEDPYSLKANGYTIKDAKNTMLQKKITGILVVDDDNHLIGILTHRDIALETDEHKNITECMTPKEKLITVKKGTSLSVAKEILRKYKIEKLPIIDTEGKLCGLITGKDILKATLNPNATKDSKGRLMVGAAVGVVGDYLERAQELINSAVDILVIDIAHGHSSLMVDTIKKIKSKYPNIPLIAGNVATGEGTRELIKAGADIIKVGIGPGSMCTTRIVTGCGVPQLTAVMECSTIAAKFSVPIIADGGIRFSGDIVKAIAAGASSVMIGSLLAGTDESPGFTMIKGGRKYKIARGMASMGANISKKTNGYFTDDLYGLSEYVAEGVEALVPYRGKANEILHQLAGGLKSGLSYCGAKNIKELQKKSRFVQITNSGLKESFPHDVEVI